MAEDEQKLDKLKAILPDNEFKRFRTYLERLIEGSVEKQEVLTFEETIEDKVQRSQVHLFFKTETTIFETDTVSQGDQRLIRVFLKHALSMNKRRKLNIVVRKAQDTNLQENF